MGRGHLLLLVRGECYMWPLYVAPACGPCMWSLHVTPACDPYMWPLSSHSVSSLRYDIYFVPLVHICVKCTCTSSLSCTSLPPSLPPSLPLSLPLSLSLTSLFPSLPLPPLSLPPSLLPPSFPPSLSFILLAIE